MTPITADTPHRFVSCDDCGEPTDRWFTEEGPDGQTYETAICYHCQQSREDWAADELDAEYDRVSI